MLLSSCTAQRAASERLGTFFSQSCERDIPVCNEEALKHVLKDACNDRSENSVRAMKEMIQRQQDAVCTLGIVFSIKHPSFALVRHSEWILNHLVRNDLLVELDNRVIKSSPCESHNGNLAPRSTPLHNRILVGRCDDEDKQPRFQQSWFPGLIGGSGVCFASRRSAASSWSVAFESIG